MSIVQVVPPREIRKWTRYAKKGKYIPRDLFDSHDGTSIDLTPKELALIALHSLEKKYMHSIRKLK